MYNIKVIKSFRKTISLTITREGEIIVKAPYLCNDKKIKDFVNLKSAWIDKNLNKINEVNCVPKFSNQDINKLKTMAKERILPLIEKYAKILNVNYKNVTIKAQKTLWGSCSKKGNLNFNCLLILTPEKVMEYVVIHELCHVKEMNHSRKFWDLVKNVMPEYKTYRKWLKDNGISLLIRL